jgi:dihydrofolate synthase/folylpolyglutamate synthase
MAIETYQQAVEFWNSRVNYEKAGMPQDLGALKLDRMRMLIGLLGNPHQKYKIIHVAGTKGKGSTSAMLASILQAGGFRTGLYTSPHLVDVEERVQIDGRPISQAELTSCMDEVAQACRQVERREAAPTFFEIITAVGLLHFARQGAEWAVLEVGLGGRFDATNICRPQIAIITSISLDHTQQLGDTLESIAMEKAGIIKTDAPVVAGVRERGPLQVIRKRAAEHQARLYLLGEDFDYAWQPGSPETGDLPLLNFRMGAKDFPALRLPLWGRHQADNAAVALAAIDVLSEQGLRLSDDVLARGLLRTLAPARLEIVGRRPWVIIDSAHNVASMQALVDWLETVPARRRMLLLAISRDKQLRDILTVLKGRFTEICFTRYRSSARGADPQNLFDIWREIGGQGGFVEDDAVAAWTRLKSTASPEDLLCASGSVFLAGEVRPLEVAAAIER